MVLRLLRLVEHLLEELELSCCGGEESEERKEEHEGIHFLGRYKIEPDLHQMAIELEEEKIKRQRIDTSPGATVDPHHVIDERITGRT